MYCLMKQAPNHGYIYAYMHAEKIVGGYTNLAEPLPNNTTDTSKWINNARIGGSATVGTGTGTSVSNIIDCVPGNEIRIKGAKLPSGERYMLLCKNGTADSPQAIYWGDISNNTSNNFVDISTESTEDGTVYLLKIKQYSTYVPYGFRFTMTTPEDASAVIVTVNTEIKEGKVEKVYTWTNTNHSFVPNDYDEELVALNEDINALRVDVTNLGTANRELEGSIEALETKIENIGTTEIPDYWQGHIDSKIATIKNLHRQYGRDCFSFVFMTDTHYPSNLGKISPVLAKKIMDECNIKFVLHGGDAQTRGCHSTKDALLAENIKIQAMFAPILNRMLFVEGNHDGAYATVNGVTYAKQLNEK